MTSHQNDNLRALYFRGYSAKETKVQWRHLTRPAVRQRPHHALMAQQTRDAIWPTGWLLCSTFTDNRQNSNRRRQHRSNLSRPNPYVIITPQEPWPRRQIPLPVQQTSSTRRCPSRASWSAAPASRPSRGSVLPPPTFPLPRSRPVHATDTIHRQKSPKKRRN